MLNTAKTIAGYLFTLADRLLPFDLGASSVQKIYNYLEYPKLELTTSGQPTEHQLALIAEAGFRVVLNLAPHNVENALPDEALVVQNLGMQYCHSPVDFKRPSDQNFSQFVELVEKHQAEKLWIHCAANMRVSAFVYRYRCQHLGHPAEQARADLHKIWQPLGVWKHFVKKPWLGPSKSQ